MFHVSNGFLRQIFDRVITWVFSLYNLTENGGIYNEEITCTYDGAYHDTEPYSLRR